MKRIHVFGPVPSRRLGRSLGVDLTPAKTCSLDCRYCQLTPTQTPIAERGNFVDTDLVLRELKAVLAEIDPPDWITFSGTGEPTLHIGLGKLLREIREMSSRPICVITNGTLLGRPDVREDLMFADRVMPTLTTVDEETFRRIHRPSPGIILSDILDGLHTFLMSFTGFIEIETFVLPGINNSPELVTALGKFLRSLPRLDAIYLNTAVRTPVDPTIRAATAEELKHFRELLAISKTLVTTALDCNAIPAVPGRSRTVKDDEILGLLLRHPCTIEQLAAVLGAPAEYISERIDILMMAGDVARNPDSTWRIRANEK
ncbi:MAG: radical SAM protein [Candidatus Riflebacteria bacterium]|nr:radical SAM protein [Candidatus Riflebacteria bacterium]